DQPALQAMLDYYRAALDLNIIDPRILDAGQPADLWASFLADPTGMINIDAHSYLMGRRLLHNTQATAIPTQEGQVVTVGRGWAFALVTKDPSRQNHALKLIETFLQTDVNAAWATRSSVIPTRQAAFALVAEDDPYWAFLDSYLQTTVPPPLFAGYDQLGRILQQAVVQVISGDATPAEAAEAAVTALNQ
ncbi:MAG: hypothetical protein ACE5G8_16835, partial [Anaerolineae bacterium]